jgi:heme-degrading monooxygenase HmoA
MHVRIARFEGATAEQAEIGRRLAREEFLPQMQQMTGYAGAGILADAGAGTALNLVFFDTEEALGNGDRELNSMTPPDEFSGIRRTSVEQYEVAFREIGGGPAAARVTLLSAPVDRIDEHIRTAKDEILPRASALDGWQGVILGVDRTTGDGIIVTLWESTEALQASEGATNKLRQETADATGGTIVSVERFEVVLLEVPVRAGIS